MKRGAQVTVELPQKRKRGRPPGSKNKKQPSLTSTAKPDKKRKVAIPLNQSPIISSPTTQNYVNRLKEKAAALTEQLNKTQHENKGDENEENKRGSTFNNDSAVEVAVPKSSIIRFKNSYGGITTIHNGHIYYTDKRSDGRIYVYCSMGKKANCKAGLLPSEVPAMPNGYERGVIVWENQTVAPIGAHTHASQEDKIDRDLAKAKLKEKIKEQPHVPPQVHFEAVKDGICNDNAKAMFGTFYTKKTQLYNTKNEHLPPIPDSIDKIIDTLSDKEASYNENDIFKGFLQSSELWNGQGWMVFGDKSGLKRLARSLRWFCDGTFKLSPALFEQCFTIHTIERDISMPGVWVVMTARTKDMYEQVFRCVCSLARDADDFLVLDEITSDFESGLLNVVAGLKKEDGTFVRVVGCHFHYAQAVLRKLSNLGFQTQYNALGSSLRRIIRRFLALPFFPSDEIQPATEFLIRQLPAKLKEFGEYFRATWLVRFKPEWWSIYNTVKRTNNLVEGWHHRMNNKLAGKLNIWQFAVVMLKENNSQTSRLLSKKAGLKHHKDRRPAADAKQTALNLIYEDYLAEVATCERQKLSGRKLDIRMSEIIISFLDNCSLHIDEITSFC